MNMTLTLLHCVRLFFLISFFIIHNCYCQSQLIYPTFNYHILRDWISDIQLNGRKFSSNNERRHTGIWTFRDVSCCFFYKNIWSCVHIELHDYNSPSFFMSCMYFLENRLFHFDLLFIYTVFFKCLPYLYYPIFLFLAITPDFDVI